MTKPATPTPGDLYLVTFYFTGKYLEWNNYRIPVLASSKSQALRKAKEHLPEGIRNEHIATTIDFARPEKDYTDKHDRNGVPIVPVETRIGHLLDCYLEHAYEDALGHAATLVEILRHKAIEQAHRTSLCSEKNLKESFSVDAIWNFYGVEESYRAHHEWEEKQKSR